MLLVSLDVGCGFIETVQKPVYATISLDLNMRRVQPGLLKQLKTHGSHPLGADACNLPIRNGAIKKIYWRAILEHLPTPEQALTEGRRVLKQGGEADIILPIITSQMRHFLVILFTQFPFSLYSTYTVLRQAYRVRHIPGMPHIKDVKPENLKPYFSKIETKAIFFRHKWFHTPWGHITLRLVNHRYIPDIQGHYHVRCYK